MKRSHSVIPFTLSLVLSLLLGLFSAQPSFAELSCTSLLESPLYRPVALKTQPSQVLSDPLIEEARELKAFDDFKILSDLTPKRLHSSDVEEVLARTYCDVRAECESGKDFTAAFDGQASKYNGVMLNSILYLVEKDLRWFSSLLNYPANEKKFKRAADKRKRQMYKYLWDSKSKVFRDYNPYEERQSAVITADAFLPLYAGLLRFHDAKSTSRRLLRELEKPGGIMSSNVFSGKQWDAPYGWAPHHYFAVHALMKYGYVKDAERIKNKWIRTVNKVFLESGKVIEKYDVVKVAAPHEDGEKYITQEGFGWTNGVIQHFLF